MIVYIKNNLSQDICVKLANIFNLNKAIVSVSESACQVVNNIKTSKEFCEGAAEGRATITDQRPKTQK